MNTREPNPGWNEGDVFALLSEGEGIDRPAWQTELQASLGGSCAAPLHITCQKATPADEGQVQELKRIFLEWLGPLDPIAVEGRRVEVWYSAFRSAGIAKCLVPVGERLETAINGINFELDRLEIERHYHIEPVPDHVPVTVLEGLNVDTAIAESDHRIVQRRIFIAAELIVSRSVGTRGFEVLARLPLGSRGG